MRYREVRLRRTPLRVTCAAWLLALLIPVGAVSNVAAQVPAPEDVFGFPVGADHRLADYDQILSYFEALDAASERVALERIGTSTLGRPMLLALISSEANLASRKRYRQIAARLARAEGLGEAKARALAREGRAVVWIDGGLHATEVAHGQHTSELAWWLATDEGDEARRIRENTILLLMPVMNPDGLDIVVDWYRGNVGTRYETAPLPELYHHYIGHDNNRDWYMFTQAETRAVADQLYHRWFPQIVYNHHQSGPFPGRIWIPPFENPVNPNLDPLVVSSINQLGESMRKRFDEEGKPGVSSGIVYDMWWNGSMRGAPDFHNMLGFLTETALYRYATPHCYEQEEIPETFGARADYLPARRPTTGYTNPWLGGCWHLRDPVEYMLTADRAVLGMAAKQREEYLYNIYRMGRRQIERGRRAEGGPFAYVIDLAAQHDPGAAVEMLRVFRQGGIEIRRAARDFRADGREFPAGSYVIGPQAFRPFVVDLIEPKTYPDRRLYPGGPPEPPYDMTGYELALQMGVAVERVVEPFELPPGAVGAVPPTAGGTTGRGAWGWVLPHERNATATLVNRLLERNATVAWATDAFDAGDRSWPSGAVVVRGVDRDVLDRLARDLGVEARGIDAAPAAPLRTVRPPRIGLYKGRVPNMAEGWTRWVLEGHAFAYETVTDSMMRAGALDRFDIVVLADQEPAEILDGWSADEMPSEYVGGIGGEGVAALRRYVDGGGWLLAIDEAATFAIDQLGLPVRNVVAGLEPSDFFVPGSLIRIDVDPSDPLGHGMPSDAMAFFVRSQVLETTTPEAGSPAGVPVSYVRYAPSDALASGWAQGADRHLLGRSAAVRVPYGEGQVVLLGFRPHFRGQPHNTYKLLFNPLHASTLDDDAWSGSISSRSF